MTWPAVPEGEFYAHIDLNKTATSEKYHWGQYHQTVRAGVRELHAFEPEKIDLCGRAYVVSPEVFIDIDLASCEAIIQPLFERNPSSTELKVLNYHIKPFIICTPIYESGLVTVVINTLIIGH